MKLHYVIQKQLSNRGCRIGMFDKEEVDIFCKTIHNDKYHRKPIGFRKALNKIYGDVSPRLLRNRQGIQ
jgi:hypothetical protein